MRDQIHGLRFSPARERADGLIGFVSFKLGALILDRIVVRRAQNGRVVLSFPERVDRAGVAHPIVRPLDQAAREEITGQVIEQLQQLGMLP